MSEINTAEQTDALASEQRKLELEQRKRELEHVNKQQEKRINDVALGYMRHFGKDALFCTFPEHCKTSCIIA
jgi:hypothetical protein